MKCLVAEGGPRAQHACISGGALGDVIDDPEELVGLVAVLSGEGDEFSRSCDHGALFGCAGDGDASAAAELEQSLVA